MANEITFGYRISATLTYGAYQPDGTVRTAAGTGLTETDVGVSGYYIATDASITAGDFVIVKEGTLVVGQGQYQPEVSASGISGDVTAIAADVTAILEDTSTTIPAAIQEIVTSNNSVTNVYDDSTPPPLNVINETLRT